MLKIYLGMLDKTQHQKIEIYHQKKIRGGIHSSILCVLHFSKKPKY